MRTIIFGSRTFGRVIDWTSKRDIEIANAQQDLIQSTLLMYLDKISFGIVGGAVGADTLGEEWLKKHGIPHQVFKPDWKKYGKLAGPKRNRQMLVEGQAEWALGFIDYRHRAAISPGSSNMIQQCLKHGIEARWHG